jgi:sugar/nucleoside kinase (ribokinase family)
MTPCFDVLGLGCVAIDDLLYVASYPPADAKEPVRRRDRQCGGLTATALVAAARLGSACAYAGTLGNDEESAFVLNRLTAEGIDAAHVRHRPGTRPIHATVIVDETNGTRTIFYDLAGAVGAEPDWPSEEVLRSARVLFVDHFGTEGMIRAARIARAAGNPVVADFESDQGPGFADLLALVDHLIVSAEFASTLAGTCDPAKAVDCLWQEGRAAVVVTRGADGCWFCSPDVSGHLPALAVGTVDTTGCGDVFHGAYASALARGLPLGERLRFAAAAAALKAARGGGHAGIPTRPQVESFLRERSP